MKNLLIAFLALSPLTGYSAILVSYDFNNGTNQASTTNPALGSATDFVPTSSLNNVNRPVIYPTSGGQGWTGAPSSETADSTANAVTQNDYYAFTVTATAGTVLNLTRISFGTAYYHVSSAASVTSTYALRSSIGSYQTDVGTPFAENHVVTSSPAFTAREIDLSASQYQNLSTITFRIYLSDNSTSTSRYVSLDDVTLEGTIAPIPEPSSSVLLFGTIGGMMLRRRRV